MTRWFEKVGPMVSLISVGPTTRLEPGRNYQIPLFCWVVCGGCRCQGDEGVMWWCQWEKANLNGSSWPHSRGEGGHFLSEKALTSFWQSDWYLHRWRVFSFQSWLGCGASKSAGSSSPCFSMKVSVTSPKSDNGAVVTRSHAPVRCTVDTSRTR